MIEVRVAGFEDIPAMHRIRLAVRENRLTTTVITETDYMTPLSITGRGWVTVRDDGIGGFAIALRETGAIWALFVDPACEGQGHGRCLLETAQAWLASLGHVRIHLNTEPGTRAEGFYRALGWHAAGTNDLGEILFEREP